MVKWCAYCQKFLGEIAPIANSAMSHGICLFCAEQGLEIPADREARIQRLSKMHLQFYQLGSRKNFAEAVKLVEEARKIGIRPIDILAGFVFPQLRCLSSNVEYKAFASDPKLIDFCQKLVEISRNSLETKLNPNVKPDVLLVSVANEVPVIELQIMEVWLQGEGIYATALNPVVSASDVFEICRAHHPKVLGLYILDQSSAKMFQEAIDLIANSESVPPLYLALGDQVKRGYIDTNWIPSAALIEDDSKLFLTIKTHLSLGFLYDLKRRGNNESE